MKKLSLSLLFILSLLSHSFAHTDQIEKSKHYQKIHYANIYADLLIEQFDKALVDDDFNLNTSKVYTKLLAAREYIESSGEVSDYGEKSFLSVSNPELFEAVITEINSSAEKILIHYDQVKNRETNGSVVYPSVGRDGNITGNTFPNGVWSLTFDDGPRSKRTEAVVDNLYSLGMKASFFMLTREAKKFKSSVDYVADAQMEVALHSYNHKDLNKANLTTIEYEVGTALKDLEELSKSKITLFRLPYGSGLRNTPLRSKIASHNLIHIFWNVDTLDWKDKNPESIFKRTLLQMKKSPKNSGVILFHDIHSQTVTASKMVMEYLSKENLTVCTVGDVINYLNGLDSTCL